MLHTTQIKQGVSFIAANKVYISINKTQSFESRRNSSFFLPGVDASHVYVRALALGCFYSHVASLVRLLLQSCLSEGADRVGGQLRGDKEYPFSGVTKSGRVWRKVPESDARSVRCMLGFAPAPRFFRIQILCRLYKGPSDETTDIGPPPCICMQKDPHTNVKDLVKSSVDYGNIKITQQPYNIFSL